MENHRLISLVRSIIILPGTVLLFIPGIILWLCRNSTLAASWTSPSSASFWLGLSSLLVGIVLAVWTVRLQLLLGEGTPAPWDPPKKLVVRGPYRHVRNPMITGAILILIAEALLLQSWPIALWMMIFVMANLIYLPWVEERDLAERFGQSYLEYKEAVPRWIPRIKPWPEEP